MKTVGLGGRSWEFLLSEMGTHWKVGGRRWGEGEERKEIDARMFLAVRQITLPISR
jgi:hypothetical protein